MDDDERTLIELNTRFIDAFRVGSIEMLDSVLDDAFIYLDGATGRTADRATYRATLTGPTPTLAVDDVRVHVFGDTAVATGRTTRDGVSYKRYVDTWRRADGRWTCVHGGLWPVPPEAAP